MEKNWIVLNTNQLDKLVELEYLHAENLEDMHEALLNTVEDSYTWRNEIVITKKPYELGMVRGHLNLHTADGISLDELLAIKEK